MELRPAPRDYLPLWLACEPSRRSDATAFAELISTAELEGCCRIRTGPESGQVRLEGRTAEALAAQVRGWSHRASFVLNIGATQVAYRETLGRRAEIDYTHKTPTGGTGQFARVKLIFEPLPPGSGFVFENEIVGGSIPKEFIPGVEKGLRAAASSGPLLGFPVIDFKVGLIDGAYHDVDSSVLTFEIAARVAFREASEKVAMHLLEPIMKLEVVSPDDHVGTVIGDLNSRRGVIIGQAMHGNATVIKALAPYASLWNYAADLQNATAGKARCSGELAGLAVVPTDGDLPPAVAQRMTA